jgi:pyrophosphatase PpaX
MQHIEAILFDLDGTLLDTTDLIVASFQHVARIYLGREVTLEELLPSFGKPLIEGLEELMPGKGQEMVLTYREFNLQHHDNMVKIFPGIKEMLQELKQRKIKLGIVTSKVKKTAIKGLELFGIEQLFDVIIGLEDTTIHKPNPEPVLLALELVQTAPGRCLMVGDSPHDIVSAQRAGVATAAVSWSNIPLQSLLELKPTFVLNNASELVKIVDKLNSI